MTSDATILCVAVATVAVILFPFLQRMRRADALAAQEAEEAARKGLNEPVTMYPVVDTDTCIGIGNCVDACPEGTVIALDTGQARTIAPGKCIGHGLCERSCPVNAITLVFGTATRGVELPRITDRFETNVPGLYVIGELGGMGLIRNAFEQGKQCVDALRRYRGHASAGRYDVVIIGCGPAGLAASLYCRHHGLSFATLEREADIGGTVRHYPRKKIVMTEPVSIPGYGKVGAREIRKEELIRMWEDVVRRTELVVHAGHAVESVDRLPGGGFTVRSRAGEFAAERVILAIGRRGAPRKLNVPGEDAPKVVYSLREPEAYQHDHVLVVGGGDSAVEAALALADQPGNVVSLSYRRDRFARIKEDNRSRIDSAARAGRVEILWETTVSQIGADSVRLTGADGSVRDLRNDVVGVFIGGLLPTGFLRACGVEIDTWFGQPLGAG